jgi:hypothetical protein
VSATGGGLDPPPQAPRASAATTPRHPPIRPVGRGLMRPYPCVRTNYAVFLSEPRAPSERPSRRAPPRGSAGAPRSLRSILLSRPPSPHADLPHPASRTSKPRRSRELTARSCPSNGWARTENRSAPTSSEMSLGRLADLNPTRSRRIHAGEIVDHDRHLGIGLQIAAPRSSPGSTTRFRRAVTAAPDYSPGR